MSEHMALPTETPWYPHPTIDIEYMDITNEPDGNGSSVAHVFGPLHPGDKSDSQSWKTMQANAELICRAVNSYPARAKLLAALQGILREFVHLSRPGMTAEQRVEYDAAREAIREAQP